MNACILPTPDFSDRRRESTRRKTAPRASPGGIAKWIHLGFAVRQDRGPSPPAKAEPLDPLLGDLTPPRFSHHALEGLSAAEDENQHQPCPLLWG